MSRVCLAMDTYETGIMLKWLGLSGVEIRAGGHTLLIDPVFTRLAPQRAAFGTIEPDERAIRSRLARCDSVFITHAHYDHLMDAPVISRRTGAALYGSPNACAIARACGAPPENVHEFRPGETVQAGPFHVTALPAAHVRLPGFGSGKLNAGLKPPLRAWQYRMDGSVVFLIEVCNYRLLAGPGLCLGDAGRVDGLLYSPVYYGGQNGDTLRRLRPRFLLPIHWEGLFLAEGKPPRPAVAPGFPPRRFDMAGFIKLAEQMGIRFVEPVVGKPYSVDELMIKGVQTAEPLRPFDQSVPNPGRGSAF